MDGKVEGTVEGLVEGAVGENDGIKVGRAKGAA